MESQRELIHRKMLAFAFKVYVVSSVKAIPATPRTDSCNQWVNLDYRDSYTQITLYSGSSERVLILRTSSYKGTGLKKQS